MLVEALNRLSRMVSCPPVPASERPGDGFFLAESEYTGAGWDTDEQRVLRIEFGPVHLYVENEY